MGEKRVSFDWGWSWRLSEGGLRWKLRVSSLSQQLFLNYVSTICLLCIGHIVTTVQHFLTKYQNLNRPNIVGGSNFSPIMWTQNNGLKNGDRICCQIRPVLNQMFQIFSSHGSSWLQQPCLPLRLENLGAILNLNLAPALNSKPLVTACQLPRSKQSTQSPSVSIHLKRLKGFIKANIANITMGSRVQRFCMNNYNELLTIPICYQSAVFKLWPSC